MSGLVTLAHYPGLAEKREQKPEIWGIRSKTAVAGVGIKGDPLQLAFRDYLETVRQPTPKSLQWCTAWPFFATLPGKRYATPQVVLSEFDLAKLTPMLDFRRTRSSSPYPWWTITRYRV